MATKKGSNDLVTVRIPASMAKDLLYALYAAVGEERLRDGGKGKMDGKRAGTSARGGRTRGKR